MSGALPVGPANLPRGAFACFAGTYALLAVFRLHAALHLDTARDLLLARDCVLDLRCGAGPRSSFGGWVQGALWSHLLELRESLGLGLAALEHAADLSLAAAAALLPIAARALERPPSALAWAVWFPATLLTIGYPTLWNPTLWPLALALFVASCLHAARTRSLPAFILAAAALALALDLHVASAVLLPFFLAAVVACAARPTLTLLLAAAVALTILHLDSPAAFADNRELLARHALALALALSLAALAGLAARRRLAARDPASRATAVLRALCLYLFISLPVLAFASGHPLHARYLAPLVTPAALLLGATRSPARRTRVLAVALAVAAYLALWLDDRLYNARFRLVEVEAVAAALYDRGLAYGDLHRHLRGPHAYDLLSTLAALEPPDGRPPANELRDILVVRAARADLPPGLPPAWQVIDLDRTHVAVIISYRPWLRLDRIDVCRTDAHDRRTCTTLAVDTAGFTRSGATRWSDRAHAPLPGLARPDRGDRISYRIPIRPPADGPAPRVRLFADECKGWRIAPADGRLPADGALEFTVIAGPRCRWWLPPYAELPADDPALDALLPPPPRDGG